MNLKNITTNFFKGIAVITFLLAELVARFIIIAVVIYAVLWTLVKVFEV